MDREDFVTFVLDQLSGLDGVRSRRMFGGHGLWIDDVFFGIVHGDRLYLKTAEATRAKYVAAGARAFRPNPRQTLKTYFEVPVEVLEDHDELARWATEAAAVQGGRS